MVKLSDALDFADKALDIAQMVPALAPVAKTAEVVLDAVRSGAALFSDDDPAELGERIRKLEQRVAEHYKQTSAALAAAAKR